jgi:hypothetical protein
MVANGSPRLDGPERLPLPVGGSGVEERVPSAGCGGTQ